MVEQIIYVIDKERTREYFILYNPLTVQEDPVASEL